MEYHTDERVRLVEVVPDATDGLIASSSRCAARLMAEVEGPAMPERAPREARPVPG